MFKLQAHTFLASYRQNYCQSKHLRSHCNMNNKIFETIGSGWGGVGGRPPDPRKNENLECQGGHLRQFWSQILVYSLFFKIVLFTIHYFIMLFIKKKFIHCSLGPHYSLIIKFFAHYSLSLFFFGHYSLIIIPHQDPLVLSK